MLDNITPKVAQSLCWRGHFWECLWAVSSLVCVLFFLHDFVCLSNLLSFYSALHASASFWDESQSGKTGPFFHLPFTPSLFLPPFSHISQSTSSTTSTTTTSSFNGQTPTQSATNSLTSPCQTHTNTQSITNPKVALPQNEHSVKAAGTEWLKKVWTMVF